MITECNHSSAKLCGSCIQKNHAEAFLDEKLRRITELEAVIDRLRGQLQNCVNHLDRANRRYDRGSYSECIEAANRALYETLSA